MLVMKPSVAYVSFVIAQVQLSLKRSGKRRQGFWRRSHKYLGKNGLTRPFVSISIFHVGRVVVLVLVQYPNRYLAFPEE